MYLATSAVLKRYCFIMHVFLFFLDYDSNKLIINLSKQLQSSIILIQLTVFTQQPCKLYLDLGGGKNR